MTPEQQALVRAAAATLEGFFVDGVVAWSLLTKENMAAAAVAMQDIRFVLDNATVVPAYPTDFKGPDEAVTHLLVKLATPMHVDTIGTVAVLKRNPEAHL